MKKIDKNTKILFILTIIFFIFVVGVSLALPDFLVNLQGINVNKLESCKLNVTLTDENAINLVSAYPMDDNDALKGKPYKVTLTKTGNCENYGYVLNMKSSCDDCTKTDGKCTIGESTCDCNNQLSSNLIRYYVKDNSTNKKYTGNNPYNMNISGSFEDGEDEKTFDMLLWIDKDATNSDLVNSNGVAKDFCSKLGAKVTNRFANNIIANQVQTMNISYKYINNANKTINGIRYNVNDNGVFLFNGTDDNGGNYPIYYYRGNVTNNNVLFGGFCWKIVRTTSTGGTKLIYNGVPSDDGKCNNTGAASQLSSTSKFNTNYDSPADVGYMYGTRYTYSLKSMDWYSLAGYSRSNLYITTTKSSMSSTNYYYGDSVTYSDGTYTLNNAEQHTWSTDYSNLKGYYTFFNSNTSGTSKPSYIVGSTSNYAYYTTYGSEKLGIGKNVTYSNETYTITDYTLVDKKDYYSSYSSYKGYYICSDNSNSCSSIRYIDITSNTRYDYVTLSDGKTYASIIEDFENNPWLYGNDVTYSNGTYTLTGKTMDSTSWSTDYKTIADGYHYTCLNSTGTCTSVYYITYFGNSSFMYYLTFTGGDNLDSAKTKMFTNTNNSTIKTAIDNWYSTNLTNYTSYLENTIFCNDRTDATTTTYRGPLASKDTNSTWYSYFKSYENMRNGTPSLECSNINDRFSLKVESGGTNGYGNNKLTYPVGLLTYDEAELAGGQYVDNSNYYLYTGSYYWLLSPAYWNYYNSYVGIVRSSGNLDWYAVNGGSGVRPAVSLQLGTEFEEGTDGTANNPYVVKTS